MRIRNTELHEISVGQHGLYEHKIQQTDRQTDRQVDSIKAINTEKNYSKHNLGLQRAVETYASNLGLFELNA